MECPRCVTTTLVELDRTGILIDRCTRCRGIWLDRGELDKLIAAEGLPPEPLADDDDDDDAPGRRGRRRRDDDGGDGIAGFFGRLFD